MILEETEIRRANSLTRICEKNLKVNLSRAFAGQEVGIKEVEDGIWIVSFLDYDLGYFDQVAKRVEPVDDPFKIKVLPMSPEWTIWGIPLARPRESLRSC